MALYTLITQGTQPLAQRLARQLPATHRVVFGAADEMPEVLLRSGNYVRIPQADSPAFAHEMLKRCLDSHVEVLIPLGKYELKPLLEAKLLFNEYGIRVLLPEQALFDQLMLFENPPAQLPLHILENGQPLNHATVDIAGPMDTGLSGVFVLSDSGDEAALCCIAD
ncbi:hypothetical protein [Parapedobacter lycopersici]|uniref:hypothetical protein n=1 Tax=Parapedobacter lycopersici TaxID=1864939 RepID=UPI00333ED2AC